MITVNLKQVIKEKYCLLVMLIFGVIFLSRLLFLGADLASTHVEIEEKSGGYNARNMVFLNHWPLYKNWFQSMIYAPVQTIFSYLSFRFFGVGLSQFRLPMVLASLFGSVFFFLILLSQTNLPLALLALLLYVFNFEMTVWNRSALTENLYLFFMPFSVYFLTKKDFKTRDLFFFVFLAALCVVAKLDGYPFYLSVVIFLFFWSLAEHSFIIKNLKALFLGSLAALAILVFLFALFGAFKYFPLMYRFYFDLFGRQALFLKGMIPTLQKLITILLSNDPYLFLAFLVSLPVLIINRQRFNRTDRFMLIFLFVTIVTRLQVPYSIIYWKRVIFLFFPVVYVISRALFFLFNPLLGSQERTPKKILLGLGVSSLYSLSVLFLFLNYFNKSIWRLFRLGDFQELFHYTKGSFIYLFLVVIVAVGIPPCWLLFVQGRFFKKLMTSLVLFLVLLSLTINLVGVGRMFLPENIKYSYQDNLKYFKLIPEREMIVGHEQGFRALVYLRKNDYYFNHDGGPNPISYREVLERNDLRYFILNVEEFWRGHWGLPNQIRLSFIKETYPNLKFLGIIFASKVPLAIYDKYGNE